MNISEFTARILLLFAPGVVSVLIIDALTVHGERKPFQFLIRSFVFGAASYTSYTVLWCVNWCFAYLLGEWAIPVSWWPEQITILRALVDNKQAIDFAEVGITAVLSVPIAFAASYAINHKYLHRAARWMRVTKKFGAPDVWGFTFELPGVEWAVVRDIQNNLIFEGWVRAFSDVESPRELLLFDVTVYRNDTGEELYSVDALYVSRKNEDWMVEFPGISQEVTQEEGNGRQTGKSRTAEDDQSDGGHRDERRAEPETDVTPTE